MAKSTKRRFLLLMNLFICFALLLCISACGSGGGRSDDEEEATTNNSKLTLEISSNTVTFGTPVTLTATLTNASGNHEPNTVVTFVAADSSLVTFTPVAATALTNDNGQATITLNAASIDSEGATSITASAPVTFQGATVTTTSKPLGVTVGGATVSLGAMTVGTSPISAYGTTSVSVPVLIGGTAATVPVSVTFNSPCVSSGKATLSSPVTSSAGIATSTYKDNGCASGTSPLSDTITASAGNETATATITVNPTAVSNIAFVSATPETIGTSAASSSTLLKSSIVKFQVVDNNNKGKSGVGVTFSMLPSNYSSFGITFTPASATSDADGYVTTSITSGSVPTPVWVVATVTGSTPAIKSQSNTLTITTGLPTQDFFSLSVSTYNIEGWQYDGETSTLTIVASDRLGNSVPDGTVVNFITEGANISDGSTPPKASCVTKDGKCTVTFTSAEYKPTDGRVTILAYAVGEKSFVDSNGNNSYNSGETYYDLGDIYLDINENRIWDSGEQYISYASGSNACLTRPSAAALPYAWNVSSKENTCNASWGINYVRRSAVLVLSGSYAYTPPATVDIGSNCVKSFGFMLYDVNNNPLPKGTEVTADNVGAYYSCIGETRGAIKATTSIASGSPVLNSTHYGGTPITLKVDSCGRCIYQIGSYPDGIVNIVATTPNGNITTIPITVTGDTIVPTLTLSATSPVKAGNGSSITAKVQDQFGHPVYGITVNFTLVNNNSGSNNTLLSLDTSTDDTGTATAYYTTGSTSGVSDTISASTSYAGHSSSDTVNISVTP